MKLQIEKERLIAQGMTPEEDPWGAYQFPRPFRTDDSLVVAFHVGRDDMTHYGDENHWYESRDRGETWHRVSPDIAPRCGLKLPGGDRIYFPPVSGIPLDGYELPPQRFRTPGTDMRAPAPEGQLPFPDGMTAWMDGTSIFAYGADRLPPSLRSKEWQLCRLPHGKTGPVYEKSELDWPFLTRVVFRREGSVPVMKGLWPQGTQKIGPDGAVYVTTFSGEGHLNPENGQYSPYYSAEIFRSDDLGHHFSLFAHMEYPADGQYYPYLSGGFSDNDFAFMPDGSLVWFFRSNWYGSTGEEWSPMYLSRSGDGGRTWTPPRRFSPLGTKPRLCTLACGITLLCYARPGIFVCATENGRDWTEPYEVMTPGDRSSLRNIPAERPAFHDWDGAGNNPDMLPLDEHSALLFYSDFYYPDTDGVRRKSILCRRITVDI